MTKKTKEAIFLGNRIRQAREESGIGSQSDLAKACGWKKDDGTPAQSRLSNYENGLREAGFGDIRDVAKATGLDIGFFYGFDSHLESREELRSNLAQLEEPGLATAIEKMWPQLSTDIKRRVSILALPFVVEQLESRSK